MEPGYRLVTSFLSHLYSVVLGGSTPALRRRLTFPPRFRMHRAFPNLPLIHVGKLVILEIGEILHCCRSASRPLLRRAARSPFSPSPPSRPYVSYLDSMLVSLILAGLPAATRCLTRCLFRMVIINKQRTLQPIIAAKTPSVPRKPGMYRGASRELYSIGPGCQPALGCC